MKRLAFFAWLMGCEPAVVSTAGNGPAESQNKAPSTAVPASASQSPFAIAPIEGERSAGPSTTKPPEPLQLSEALAPEVAPGTESELAGVSLEAQWRWGRTGELSGAEPALGHPRGVADHTLELTANGRMRLVFQSTRLSLPAGTSLLARADRYGTLLVWPDHREYRILLPGMLHATVEDRRADASPLSKATLTARGTGTLLGWPVRRIELKSAFGLVTLETARVTEAGLGAALLCRSLLEWGGIDPNSGACSGDRENELPLSATYQWGTVDGATAQLKVTKLVVHEKDAAAILVPPAEALPRSTGLPGPSTTLLVSATEQTALGVEKDATAGLKGGRTEAALSAVNLSDRTIFAVLNGTPVAYLAPKGQVRLEHLRAVRHRLQWRTFLGQDASPDADVEPPTTIRFSLESTGEDGVGDEPP